MGNGDEVVLGQLDSADSAVEPPLKISEEILKPTTSVNFAVEFSDLVLVEVENVSASPFGYAWSDLHMRPSVVLPGPYRIPKSSTKIIKGPP